MLHRLFAVLGVALFLGSATGAGWSFAAPASPESSTERSQAAAPADLPEVVINQRPVHAVPDEDVSPPPPVTLKERDGRDVALHAPPLPRHVWPTRPVVAAIPRIEGAARPGDATTLTVQGRAVRLFGIKGGAAADRCGVAGQASAASCAELGRQALAERLKQDAFVSCAVPPGQRVLPAAAVCVDSRGVDLGEFLVEQGLALADPAQSYEYAGAQDRARAARRGLWLVR